MIFDTYYWKQELKRLSRTLRRHSAQRRWTDASYASVEKSVMLGFYAVRKMLEAFQPTFQVPDELILTSFPRGTTGMSSVLWPDVAKVYDLTKPRRVRLPVRKVCDQIVHTHVFTLWFSKTGSFRGIVFSSDREKDKGVYCLQIDAVIDLFEGVASTTGPLKLLPQPEHNRLEM